MTRHHPVACVLFDLDGVLVDATEWHYEALNRALGLFGFEISRYEHLSTYNGLPTRKKLRMLTVEKGLPEAIHDMVGRLKQIYTRDEILAKCRPTFEKEYMLHRLHREGFRLACCSNSIRETLELMIRQSGISECFEFLMSNEDVSRPKPDPEIYQKAIDRMGVSPEEVLVVEDAPHGVAAAQRSGAYVCPVAGFTDVDYFTVRDALDRIERDLMRKVA